ncbi:MAG: hypothetical protein V3S26_04220 [Acidimicrobiia bacterium]
MSFRETPSYSRTAINAGDFFKNHGRQEFRDEETGELRFERTWMVERLIDVEDLGKTVEFGEKTVIQLARAIGYVSKYFHQMNKEKLADARLRVTELTQTIEDLKATNKMLIIQMAEYVAMDNMAAELE